RRRPVASHCVSAARAAAAVTGRELAAVGITTDLAPDADVNVNPANPVIGVRSFGADPARVAEMVVAQVEGYQQDAGVSACAKHFPGHGDTATDSHTGLPVIDHSQQEWQHTDLPPFEAAVAAEVDMVMTAHIRFPALEPSGEPATLSRAVLTDLLRTRLGFQGVIITDSLEMAGVRQSHSDREVPVMALAAGADLILMPPDPRGARDAIVEAVESGRIDPRQIDAKVLRVLRMKARRGMLDPVPVDPETVRQTVGTPQHLDLAADLARRAITLVHRGRVALPVDLAGRRVHVCGWRPPEHDLVSALGDALEVAGATPVARVDRADLVVCLTHDVAAGSDQARLVADLARACPAVLTVSVGTPYDLWELPAEVTQLAAYSSAETVPAAVVKVLTDDRPPCGMSPVDLSVWHNHHQVTGHRPNL
ncbi:MAG: glycoside hydrolase family 3 protein, partial [Acidipropionibacterium jensenii]|nr:glycoside hydrolase family 3 protein [Acidipropionibacterium jensenii]